MSFDREKLNVLEQKNSKHIQDGISMKEVALEVKLNGAVNKNNDLILPGSHMKVHNNSQAVFENQMFKATGSLALTTDNHHLAILSNEGLLLFQSESDRYRALNTLDLFEMKVDYEYLKGKLYSLRTLYIIISNS